MTRLPQPDTQTVPDWLAEMDFCHIFHPDDPTRSAYCGCPGMEGECPGEYNGEALCGACGLPTCPRCAQLSALEDALEDGRA